VSNLASIEHDPNYQELVRRRSSLGWILSLIMLVMYFGFTLLVAYAPKFLGMPMGSGVTTIGIPIGLSVIVLPQTYDWMMQLRIRRLYDEIRLIESEMKVEGTKIDAGALNAKLDLIDQRANQMQLPNVYASSLYTLRSHIDLVRARLAAMA
jgi:uncharacterized membrane protein (DUF485 family)